MKKTISTAVQYTVRNKALSLATIFVMATTFFITTIFIITAVGTNQILNHFESKAQINVFFKDVATEQEIMDIKSRLEQLGKTSEIEYTSKEQALQDYMSRFNEEPVLLEAITGNILPASLDIKAIQITDLPSIVEEVKREPLVEDVKYLEEVIEKLRLLTTGVRLMVFVEVGMLTIISGFIVLITIALQIYNRQEEIEIMQLIGATPGQIRAPFIFQGILFGVLASLISALIILLIVPHYVNLIDKVLFESENLNLLPINSLLIILGIQLGLGVLLGFFGSYFSTRKYLT